MLELRISDLETNEIYEGAYLYPAMDIRDFASVSKKYYEFLLTFTFGFDVYFVPSDFFEDKVSAEEVCKTVIAFNPVENKPKIMECGKLRALYHWLHTYEEEFFQYNEEANMDQRLLEGCLVGTLLAHISMQSVPNPVEWLDFIQKNAGVIIDENFAVIYSDQGGYSFIEATDTGKYSEKYDCKMYEILSFSNMVRHFHQPPAIVS